MDIPSPRAELLAGAREMAPLMVGTVPFGFVVGVAGVAAGMTPIQSLALSLASFSGIAQLVTSQLVATGSPVALTIVAALVVSLRFLMYSAAISPQLAHLDRRWRVLLSFLMTDQSFVSSMRRFAEPGDRRHRHWHFLGCAVALYASWQVAVAIGIVAGARVPASWSLDFAVVLSFIALLVPAVRTRADLAVVIVSAAVALAAAGLPYQLALVVASIAGIAAGMALESSRRER